MTDAALGGCAGTSSSFVLLPVLRIHGPARSPRRKVTCGRLRASKDCLFLFSSSDRRYRFIVTNLAGGRAKALYENLYCRCGAAKNHIKSWKTHLAADWTACTRAMANQFRLFLHAGAYWFMWGLRAVTPKCSRPAVAQYDTLRLRLIKIAARVVEVKTQIRLHLPM